MTNTHGIIEALCFLMIFCNFVASETSYGPLDGRKVLLISMDGFRHDYLEKIDTPNFDEMIAFGVKVPFVNNTFVTLTFPSHTSIATGLYEESHGIVANGFYDPLYDAYFSMRSIEPMWWNASEPIWTNAVKNGLKEHSFGQGPMSYRHYDGTVRYSERIRTVVNWLSRDQYQLAILYFDEPDHAGHVYGPEDPHVTTAVQNMDFVVGMLMAALEKANLRDKVDVIITSDHGMATTDMITKTIDVTDYVNKTLLKKAKPSFGPVMHLFPQPNKTLDLYEALKGTEHVHVFLKEDIPEHFHYRHNRHVSPVFAYADEGWTLITSKKRAATVNLKGNHGYDNSLMSMKPIFIASGPSFKRGYQLPGPIKSVDIYPLLCHLLKLTPAPNNGSLERVEPLLRASEPIVTTPTDTTVQTSPGKGTVVIYSINLPLVCALFFILVL